MYKLSDIVTVVLVIIVSLMLFAVFMYLALDSFAFMGE